MLGDGHRPLVESAVVAKKRAALPDREKLAAAEAEGHVVTVGPGSLAPNGSPKSLGGVKNQCGPGLSGDLFELWSRRRKAVQVDADDGAGVWGDPALDGFGPDRDRPRREVREDGCRPSPEHRAEGLRPRVGGKDDLVAGPDARGQKGRLQGRGPVCLGQSAGRIQLLFKKGLKRFDRPVPGDPAQRRDVVAGLPGGLFEAAGCFRVKGHVHGRSGYPF
jgi:hypothetical protein